MRAAHPELLRPPAGACSGMSVDLFYRDIGQPVAEEAVAACASCWVVESCREYIEAHESRGPISGIWGFAAGLTHTERRAARSARDATLGQILGFNRVETEIAGDPGRGT